MNECRVDGCERGIRAQFALPRGPAGWFVGHLMAAKNRERGRWVVSMLQVDSPHRVLEIGFGPGVDVARVARLTVNGLAAGVDPSGEMLRQATRRNADAIRAGRVDLRLGAATRLPFEDASFDRVFASNSVQFWGDLPRALTEIRRVLRPGGFSAISIQPRNKGATADTTRAWGERLCRALAEAGFVRIESRRVDLPPLPVVCVFGTRPASAPLERPPA